MLLQGDYSTNEGNAVTAKQVRIGRKLWSDVPLVTQDLSALSRILAAQISGVLGTDLLASVMVRISYATGTAQVVAAVPADALLMHLKKVRNVYFVPVRIGPSTFEMLLDVQGNEYDGAFEPCLALTALGVVEAHQPARRPPIERGSARIAHRVCASASTRWHRGKTDTVARLSPPSDHALSRWYLCRSSIRRHFGGDILNRFEVTLDLQHDSMYLKPERTFQPDASEFVTIGLQFFKSNADAFSVVAVWNHSPGEEAGVVIGDRIVAVNGHSRR